MSLKKGISALCLIQSYSCFYAQLNFGEQLLSVLVKSLLLRSLLTTNVCAHSIKCTWA